MKTVVIIPARWASTRLPKKPLIDILGTSMIMRVYERVLRCELVDDIIIATDNQYVYDHVISRNAHVIMTSAHHLSGTDRIAEVASKIDAGIIINVQGDEPLIHPNQIDDLIRSMKEKNAQIGTQCTIIDDSSAIFDFNLVKVIVDNDNRAIYFSRQAIPAFRDRPFREWSEHHKYQKHIGIYGFTKETLMKVSSLPISSLELAESLEQLRWIENGFTIHCFPTIYKSIGVDTQDDLSRVEDAIIKEMFH